LRYSLSPDFVGWGQKPAIQADIKHYESSASDDPLGPVYLQRGKVLSAYSNPAENIYQWTFRDLEPTETASGFSAYDIGLTYVAPTKFPMDGQANKFVVPIAKASSALKLDGYEYPAEQICDGMPSTAWAESADGPGIGQWVDFTFPESRDVKELRILPGYAKRPDLFAKYNRPKRLRFKFSDGTEKVVDLADDATLQKFAVSAKATGARMTIEDVYRGTTRDETYVSEIEFGSGTSPEFADPGTVLASMGAGAGSENASGTGGGSTASGGAARGGLSPSMLYAIAAGTSCLGFLVLVGVIVGIVLLARRKRPTEQMQSQVQSQVQSPGPAPGAPPEAPPAQWPAAQPPAQWPADTQQPPPPAQWPAEQPPAPPQA
jgi:hypothetical protein